VPLWGVPPRPRTLPRTRTRRPVWGRLGACGRVPLRAH